MRRLSHQLDCEIHFGACFDLAAIRRRFPVDPTVRSATAWQRALSLVSRGSEWQNVS
jgi:hypothetical protein